MVLLGSGRFHVLAVGSMVSRHWDGSKIGVCKENSGVEAMSNSTYTFDATERFHCLLHLQYNRPRKDRV